MQITRERVVAEIAKLTAERANHVAQIDQIAANVNCVDGCLIECRAMLAILDTPEPEPVCVPYVPVVAPDPLLPAAGDRAVVTNIPALAGYTIGDDAPEMLPVEIPAEADDLSLVERAPPQSEFSPHPVA